MRFFGMSLEDATNAARLAGRHGIEAREILPSLISGGNFLPKSHPSVQAAFDEGVEARQAGITCLCPACGPGGSRIKDNEGKRMAYWRQRNEELQAEGRSEKEIFRIVTNEVDRGMALYPFQQPIQKPAQSRHKSVLSLKRAAQTPQRKKLV